MKLASFALTMLGLSINAQALESRLCTFTSDVDDITTHLYIDTNSNGDLDTIRLSNVEDSKIISDRHYPVEVVIEDGVVANEKDGRKIVVFRANKANAVTGGPVTIDYLYNGLTGERRKLDLKMIKINGKFALTTLSGVKFNRAVMIGNKAPVVGVIGIKEVRTSLR